MIGNQTSEMEIIAGTLRLASTLSAQTPQACHPILRFVYLLDIWFYLCWEEVSIVFRLWTLSLSGRQRACGRDEGWWWPVHSKGLFEGPILHRLRPLALESTAQSITVEQRQKLLISILAMHIEITISCKRIWWGMDLRISIYCCASKVHDYSHGA